MMRNEDKKIQRTCPLCGDLMEMKVTEKQVEGINRYASGFGLIQDCLSSMDKVGREFIKSGYCPDCQELLFGMEVKTSVRKKFTRKEVQNG